MSDFKAKMHKIRFWLGLCPRPCWGSLQRYPRPLTGFKGPTSNGREGKGEEERGWEGEKERGGEGKRTPSVPPLPNLPVHRCRLYIINCFMFRHIIMTLCFFVLRLQNYLYYLTWLLYTKQHLNVYVILPNTWPVLHFHLGDLVLHFQRPQRSGPSATRPCQI